MFGIIQKLQAKETNIFARTSKKLVNLINYRIPYRKNKLSFFYDINCVKVINLNFKPWLVGQNSECSLCNSQKIEDTFSFYCQVSYTGQFKKVMAWGQSCPKKKQYQFLGGIGKNWDYF